MSDGGITAFIPLKGHSARVPGKNLRPFLGTPLFEVIVGTLQDARRVGAIYIDTDSEEIAARAATLADVSVIGRRPDLLGDEVSVNLLIKAFLEDHEDRYLIQTHATNPLLKPDTIDAAIEAFFADEHVTSLFGVTRYQARFYDRALRAVNHDPSELIPTQDLEPLYMENSNFYVFSRTGFLENDRRITDDTAVYEVDPIEAVDIDEERDFALAEALARILSAG